jgi:hypothetical protein
MYSTLLDRKRYYASLQVVTQKIAVKLLSKEGHIVDVSYEVVFSLDNEQIIHNANILRVVNDKCKT